MRIKKTTGATALLLTAASLMLLSPTSASAATGQTKITLSNIRLDVVDDDGALTSTNNARFANRTLFVSASQPHAFTKFEACAGDEVRIEVVVGFDWEGEGLVSVNKFVDLIEGASCSSEDIDGSISKFHTYSVPQSVVDVAGLKVVNTDEGGSDSGTFRTDLNFAKV
ncbi:hypothetical protein [Streptomyces sp. NBC_00233]|uniref:hypothetical protein n=1 Tax=Streptomyces sp. NBC_00233 TaxID=2975686 RepID=UPI002256F98E|nr:hypothetical protein [Streptomyces sp. NBC_00233]MCX5233215.1 hypothetical protein [Streptomyces sp. NBC_00233]